MPSSYDALLRDPVSITICGTHVLLPYRPAADWIRALRKIQTLAVALADDRGRDVILDLVIDNPLAHHEIEAESLRILGEAANRNWWGTARLLATSATPEVLGRLVLAGVDPHARSVGEWCAAVYSVCVKGQDEKGRIRFDFSLAVPPTGYEDAWDDEGVDPVEMAKAAAAMTRKR